MVTSERSSARRHRRRDSREMTGHDVGVPLDDNDLAVLRNIALREIKPVEDFRLVIHGRLGGIQVLRAVVVIAKSTRSEPNRCACHVANRPD